ncbi:FliC/FljB family flagellin [Achromobacter sp. GG226]|uniref:FliC/FljB family flagellin n=1 Tax=Verticiella alkaliphila TaxID=2779529 RepID=UPI001C0ADB85|nr:FliC/FljB family flagellin [Verticiella sp. GG226]MBU4610476.1 FliC/FljB family flagellin [Verticiella sp. GG226]
MSVISTNYLSLVAQNNLQKSQSALGTAIERLSSGQRINSAKDDAAGQAIANRFTANVKGLQQAARNANDGISIAQTTEGALNEINNNLQRVRELTVQAQNGSNSASDIDSIQQEVNQRLEEINRVAEQTDFNGIKVLNSAVATKLSIQVGANDNQTIDIDIAGNTGWNFASGAPTVASGVVNGNSRTGTISGFDVLQSAASTVTADMPSVATANTAAVTESGFTAAPTSSIYAYGDGTVYAAVVTSGTDSKAYAVSFDSAGAAVLGRELDAVGTQAAVAASATAANEVATGQTENVTVRGTSTALQTIDDALKAVDNQRSALGAIQNRFESTVTNLNNTVTNLSAARSRIEDADYAVEVSNMTRAQILQQAGTSVLAQANQVPQGVLSLLR